jgi:hypothetical protein
VKWQVRLKVRRWLPRLSGNHEVWTVQQMQKFFRGPFEESSNALSAVRWESITGWELFIDGPVRRTGRVR